MKSAEPDRPSATEEVAAAPGWVEPELERILGGVAGDALKPARDAYLDTISAAGPTTSFEAAHDRARSTLLRALDAAGVAPDERARIERDLRALEADILDRAF